MSHKLCPNCHKKNAMGNSACIACSSSLIYEPVLKESKSSSLLERIVSSLLLSCAAVSVFFAVLTLLNHPAVSAFYSFY